MSSTTAADRRLLQGRTAVVTGASRGIGKEITRGLMDSGAFVVMLARDLAAMQELVKDARAECRAIAVDLADADALAKLLPDLARQLNGAPDILVNNAAQFDVAPADQLPVDAFARALQVNLVAHFAIVRAFLPAMNARRRGHIVTIGSIADRQGLPGNAAYASSKFGLRGLHEVLRSELAGTGVRATLVAPAHVDTTIWAETPAAPDIPSRVDMLSPTSVADAVLFAVTREPDVNIDEIRLSRA